MEGVAPPEKDGYPVYARESGLSCPNPRCVSVQATELKYLTPEFKIVDRNPLTLRCVYCEHGFEPKFAASTEWHEGKNETKRYHQAGSHTARIIRPENLIIFNSAADAEACGYKPSHYV